MPASEIMDASPSVLQDNDTIASAIDIIMSKHHRTLPVVDEKGCYLGMFGVHHLLNLLLPPAVIIDGGLTTAPFVQDTLKDMYKRLSQIKEQDVTCCMDHRKPISPDTPVLETLLVLHNSQAAIPVVDPESNCLVGMISYWDLGESILGAGSE